MANHAANPDVTVDDVITNNGEERGAKRSYQEILRNEIREGLHELKRPSLGLFVSSFAGGLEVSFSILLMGTMMTLVDGRVSEVSTAFLIATSYSLGFIFVILGRSELFTEHTTLAVLPVLNGRSTFHNLMRLWGLVWIGNILGAALFSALTAFLGPAMGSIEPEALYKIASKLTHQEPWVMLGSAVLAGWLMGLLSWLVAAARESIAQIVLVWLITFSIGLAQLHHSIVGTAEVLSAVFAGTGIPFSDYIRFIILATIGNAIGGAFFVAFMKYRHASVHSPEYHKNIPV